MNRHPETTGGPEPTGPDFWRSLEERCDSPEFRRWVENEFPPGVAEGLSGPSRREVLKLMAASFALAGVTGCGRQPPEAIVPRVRSDEATPRAKPLYFATSLTLDGYARGALVESYLGRPIKVEGNPDHPASLGATDAFGQAALLEMYDPDRSQAVVRGREISTWPAFAEELAHRVDVAKAKTGAGFHLLTGPTTSPMVLHQIGALLVRWPEARWYVHAAIGRSRTLEGARLAFGRALEPVLRVDRAQVILSIDDDFLYARPGHLRHAREFGAKRSVNPDTPSSATMNRLYVVEPSPTVTGTNADHRLAVASGGISAIALALARGVGAPLGDAGAAGGRQLDEREIRWVRAAARDLGQHQGRSLVTVGESQPPQVHALAHAINAHLGNLGQTIGMIEPVSAEGDERAGTPADLARRLGAGDVETLLMLDVNPAYDAPADLLFDERIGKARWSAHLGLYRDETARRCDWHLPSAHELESWGDARAFDATAGIIQPLIEPLYHGRTPAQVLAMLDSGRADPCAALEHYWRKRMRRQDGGFWRDTLRRGIIDGTVSDPVAAEIDSDTVAEIASEIAMAELTGEGPQEVDLHFAPDPSVWDGRFANNGWLQELPRPVTKLTWDNALMVSPATADRMELKNGHVLELQADGRKISAPVWVTPGQADKCFTLSLGYGRGRAGRVGSGVGVNAYRMRTSVSPWSSTVRAFATEERVELVSTQHHQLMEKRGLVRTGTLRAYQAHPGAITHDVHLPVLSLYPERQDGDPQWGMVINLGACIGCNACIIACQAENNIPVVGKSEVAVGREMHWIRVDRYFEGDPQQPLMHHQPVPCMHCENAPCEVVCPVAATAHSRDGLNEMTYNRCIGTRYCSNNCPYKVRRFNFLNYNKEPQPSVQLRQNPEVTVRGRGVMEKCTYCVQRIRRAQIEVRKENRPMLDGAVVTACQQVCPTQAITFGNIADAGSAVCVARQHPLHYGLLVELNTRPRTTYLAGLRNPNPDLPGTEEAHG